MTKTLSNILLPEFDREMATTSRLLTIVTPESMAYKPADPLHTIGWNANHLLDIVGWTVDILQKSEFDLAPVDGPPIAPTNIADPSEIVRQFNLALAPAKEALASATDEQMAERWSLKMKGEVLFSISKGECIRTWVLNHNVHHRAILSVYLRMFGIEVASVMES